MVYTLPLNPDIGKVTLDLNWTYTSRQIIQASAPKPFDYLPSSRLANLDLSWTGVYGSPVDLDFFITDLFDAFIPTYYTDLEGGGSNLGFDLRTLAPPRMFGGRLKYHF